MQQPNSMVQGRAVPAGAMMPQQQMVPGTMMAMQQQMPPGTMMAQPAMMQQQNLIQQQQNIIQQQQNMIQQQNAIQQQQQQHMMAGMVGGHAQQAQGHMPQQQPQQEQVQQVPNPMPNNMHPQAQRPRQGSSASQQDASAALSQTLYRSGEDLGTTVPGFLQRILLDEVRVHTNRSVVTVAASAADHEQEQVRLWDAFKEMLIKIRATSAYVYTLVYANRGFCVPAAGLYFAIVLRCALSVELLDDGSTWRELNATCNDWGENGSDYVPEMLATILPIFFVVFYVNAAIKRYYAMYDACRNMSDITDQAIGIALVDFRKHPECLKEEVRCVHLARIMVLLCTAKETYPVNSFFLPLARCFGDKSHGLITEAECQKLKKEGYSEHLSQYFTIKLLGVLLAANHKGLISDPGTGNRMTHILQMLDASQQIRSLVAMQYPPTYTYLVSSTVGISCLLEIAFASTRVGLQWGQMMFWESLVTTFFLLVAQQVVLFGILGVAGEMIDPFGEDIRDFPILEMCVGPLQHSMALVSKYTCFRDDDESNLLWQQELGPPKDGKHGYKIEGQQDVTKIHRFSGQRYHESTMLSREALLTVKPKDLGAANNRHSATTLQHLQRQIAHNKLMEDKDTELSRRPSLLK
ncbi:unnamed protein product [Amoebophrya sp. A25]|nr:unnamed protein product [Amoebophrya sp. A25]|eukprot:GSA25T00026682001.1